ncbi:MAG: hypothetical protein KGM42_20020 [Hyphomicrobiales bacterium]|nr:hypothetical protein [Hyphomicrobiales bacterium]
MIRNIAGVAAGAFLALAAACAPARADMRFRVVSISGSTPCGAHCAMAIAADGDITDSTAAEFVAFVKENAGRQNLHSVVLLNSPGGKVVGAMDFGRVLRRIGALAIVARAMEDPEGAEHIAQGRCFSACVYALMGGRKRIIPAKSLVGIHRMFAVENAVDPAGGSMVERRFDNGDMRNVIAKYSAEMGVSRELINKAERVSTDTIHLVSPQEIARWRLGSSRF